MWRNKKWEFHGDFSSKDVGFEMFEPNINGNFRIQQMEVREYHMFGYILWGYSLKFSPEK